MRVPERIAKLRALAAAYESIQILEVELGYEEPGQSDGNLGARAQEPAPLSLEPNVDSAAVKAMDRQDVRRVFIQPLTPQGQPFEAHPDALPKGARFRVMVELVERGRRTCRSAWGTFEAGYDTIDQATFVLLAVATWLGCSSRWDPMEAKPGWVWDGEVLEWSRS